MKAFLDHGANINVDNGDSERPLQLASYCGELKSLGYLLPLKEIDDDDKYGDTALHQATASGHTECAKLLAYHGTDPNCANLRGRTAIYDVALYGYIECLECLLEHNADLNYTDKHNRTPLFFACLGDSQKLAGHHFAR